MITYLADYPQYLPTVAGWIFDEWGWEMPGSTLESIQAEFSLHLNRDRIPLTMLALVEGQPVGTASIFLHDMDTRMDLTPWLAAVYVVPEFRGQGDWLAAGAGDRRRSSQVTIGAAVSFYTRPGRLLCPFGLVGAGDSRISPSFERDHDKIISGGSLMERFKLEGKRVIWTGHGEVVWVEPYGANIIRVRASKALKIDLNDWTLLPAEADDARGRNKR